MALQNPHPDFFFCRFMADTHSNVENSKLKLTQRCDVDFGFLPLLLIFFYGVFLRTWGIDQNQIFADEIHTLKCAAENSFLWILKNFATHDACIPLTLYNKFLLETVGLNEWLFRLPAILAGSALLFAVYRFMKNQFRPAETILVVGFLAVSPYWVYMGREARPYIINMFLIWAAFAAIMKWRKNRNIFTLLLVFALLALGLFFHPVVLPAILIIILFPPAILIYEKASVRQWTHYLVAVILFLAIVICLMTPSLASLMSGVSQKSGKGEADLTTITHSLYLLHGLPVAFPFWIWLVPIMLGFARLLKRHPLETLLVLLALILQLVFLFYVQPRKTEIPWVWLRYSAHLLPWVIICWASGLISMISFLIPKKKNRFLLPTISMLLVVCFSLFHIYYRNYAIFRSSSYNVHPIIIMIDKNRSLHNGSPVFGSYDNIREILSRGNIIEAPMLFTFPLYQFYQFSYNYQFKTLGLGPGYGQGVFTDHAGFCFNTVYRSQDREAGIADRRDSFLIIHKKIGAELQWAYEFFGKEDMASKQIIPMEYLFAPPVLQHMFGNHGTINPSDSDIAGENIYEDNWIQVLRLQ